MKNQNPSTHSSAGQVQHDSGSLLLDQINLNIGESIQLQAGSKCHFAALVGYLKEKSFIVSTPDENGALFQPVQDQPLVVRFISDHRAFAFDTAVKHIAHEPFPHLHLAYPEKIRVLKERQYDRIRVNISGTADISNGTSFDCIVRDISIGGALIELRSQTGVINDPLLLTLLVVINGVEYELSLDSEIRSVRVGDPTSDNVPPVLQGLAFNDLSEQDVLALAAFDLLPDWNALA